MQIFKFILLVAQLPSAVNGRKKNDSSKRDVIDPASVVSSSLSEFMPSQEEATIPGFFSICHAKSNSHKGRTYSVLQGKDGLRKILAYPSLKQLGSGVCEGSGHRELDSRAQANAQKSDSLENHQQFCCAFPCKRNSESKIHHNSKNLSTLAIALTFRDRFKNSSLQTNFRVQKEVQTMPLKPFRVLIIGDSSFSIPHLVASYFPQSVIDVIIPEDDACLHFISGACFGIPKGLTVHSLPQEESLIHYIQNNFVKDDSTNSYEVFDVIFLLVPSHTSKGSNIHIGEIYKYQSNKSMKKETLRTKDFLEAVYSRTKPGGTIAISMYQNKQIVENIDGVDKHEENDNCSPIYRSVVQSVWGATLSIIQTKSNNEILLSRKCPTNNTDNTNTSSNEIKCSLLQTSMIGNTKYKNIENSSLISNHLFSPAFILSQLIASPVLSTMISDDILNIDDILSFTKFTTSILKQNEYMDKDEKWVNKILQKMLLYATLLPSIQLHGMDNDISVNKIISSSAIFCKYLLFFEDENEFQKSKDFALQNRRGTYIMHNRRDKASNDRFIKKLLSRMYGSGFSASLRKGPRGVINSIIPGMYEV